MNILIHNKRIKWHLQRMVAGQLPAIIVASMGRSGSTLLHDAVTASWATLRFPYFLSFGRWLLHEGAWQLDRQELVGGVVYKTHDLPCYISTRRKVKALFVFGRPSDVARSVYACAKRNGDRWFESHRQHLRGVGTLEDFLMGDTLHFEEQLNLWTQAQHLDVLCVRYEAMWRHLDEVNSFLGFPIRLPNWRERSDMHIPGEISERIISTYGALDQKVLHLPDVIRTR